jgi:hypothetical protein
VLNTYNQTQADSNAECRQAGGSLVTFRSVAQQQEVEQLYVAQGLLFPQYHRVRGWGWGCTRAVHEAGACLDVHGSSRGCHELPEAAHHCLLCAQDSLQRCSNTCASHDTARPRTLQVYWMGLSSDRRSYPRFRWLDPSTPSLALASSYKHWGLMMPQNQYEPFAVFPPEYCGVGNFSQTYQGASGWSDANCDNIFVSICQIRRGGPPAAAAAAAAAAAEVFAQRPLVIAVIYISAAAACIVLCPAHDKPARCISRTMHSTAHTAPRTAHHA